MEKEGELSGLGKNIDLLKDRHQSGLNQKTAFAGLKKKSLKTKEKDKNNEVYQDDTEEEDLGLDNIDELSESSWTTNKLSDRSCIDIAKVIAATGIKIQEAPLNIKKIQTMGMIPNRTEKINNNQNYKLYQTNNVIQSKD